MDTKLFIINVNFYNINFHDRMYYMNSSSNQNGFKTESKILEMYPSSLLEGSRVHFFQIGINLLFIQGKKKKEKKSQQYYIDHITQGSESPVLVRPGQAMFKP